MFNNLTVLSPAGIEGIHEATLELLRDVGVHIPDSEAPWMPGPAWSVRSHS